MNTLFHRKFGLFNKSNWYKTHFHLVLSNEPVLFAFYF